jgi:UDP-N-acetyl-D-mannosaminuronic acid dehydrogenase
MRINLVMEVGLMKTNGFYSSLKSADVCIVGMGYVGLTLAVTLAEAGLRVIGCEANQQVCCLLNTGQPHFFEKGLVEILQRHIGHSLTVRTDLPTPLPPTVVVCVGSPVNARTKEPDLRQLESAVRAITERVRPETLIIVRSTVPVGTSRNFIAPLLRQKVSEPLLAFCPERTIQGKALEELRNLPQIVGGLNEAAIERAKTLFETFASQVIPVSSVEAAETVKLLCNAHTDLIYGFGNEVAMITEALGLDANEVISAANINYPRPDLCKPGFVGGSCLTKDPYLLIHSVQSRGYYPTLIAAARRLNESLPSQVGERVLALLQESGCDPSQTKILITGFAYKGQPETDDMRGSPVKPIIDVLRRRAKRLVGHDFVVPAERIEAMGVEPVSLPVGFAQAGAALILNNHPQYQAQNIHDLIRQMDYPAVLYDAWGIFKNQLYAHHNNTMNYIRLGNG